MESRPYYCNKCNLFDHTLDRCYVANPILRVAREGKFNANFNNQNGATDGRVVVEAGPGSKTVDVVDCQVGGEIRGGSGCDVGALDDTGLTGGCSQMEQWEGNIVGNVKISATKEVLCESPIVVMPKLVGNPINIDLIEENFRLEVVIPLISPSTENMFKNDMFAHVSQLGDHFIANNIRYKDDSPLHNSDYFKSNINHRGRKKKL